jgi:hypothetical protein
MTLNTVQALVDTENWQLRYCPDEITIGGSERIHIQSRRNRRAAFKSHNAETGWDDLHLAYFDGYGMRSYLNRLLLAPVALPLQRCAPVPVLTDFSFAE